MATWPNSNASQGKFTKHCSGIKSSVGSPCRASTYRRLTGRRILVRTGVVELLTIIIEVIIII
jgi:hypothetical protein